MAKTNLKLYSTDGLGQDVTTTISYVNPEASKNEILDFTQNLNNLTKNIYKETERITTVNVDLETVPSTPTFTASITQFSAATFGNTNWGKESQDASLLTYNGDGNIFVENAAIMQGISIRINTIGGQRVFFPGYVSTPTFPFTFKVGFTATENYKACSVDITITA